MSPLLRFLSRWIPRAIAAAPWAGALAVTLTGAVMLVQWHRLAGGGVEIGAAVESCRRETMGGKRFRSGQVYYACTYAYQPTAGGPAYSGYFQSPREWSPGERVAVRYLPGDPATSAAAPDLEHPKVVPGAITALGLVALAWLFRKARRKTA